jgi:hypothetical protein
LKEKNQMKTIQAITMILISIFALSTAHVSALTNLTFGGKSGDWIQYQLQDDVQSAYGLPSNQWVRMEFQSVAGTNVTVNATIYTTSLTEMNITKTISLTSQDDFAMNRWFNARVYFIPGGMVAGDSVYLGQEFGFRTIAGEATISFAGANRRVIYANFTWQGNHYFYYWDEQTGVLTEGTKFLGAAFADVLVSETNMWSADVPWWLWIILWIIIIIVVALGVLSSRKNITKKLHRKTMPNPPRQTSLPSARLLKREKLIERAGLSSRPWSNVYIRLEC